MKNKLTIALITLPFLIFFALLLKHNISQSADAAINQTAALEYRINQLESEKADLESRVDDLESRLEDLEYRFN